ENFQPAVIRKWIDTAEQEGSEYAVAAVLEFLPSAKTNPSAYLHRMLGEKIKPSVANTNSAKEILEAIGKMNKTIGEEILPKDWVRFAGVLGIRVKMGSVQELASQQTALMARFEKFMAQFER
ncbi:MAG: hypothetical protein LBJ22_02470, partial [Synergistaceae bacterium]|nr:hypothetical protein [Synergistaceae bacterium]